AAPAPTPVTDPQETAALSLVERGDCKRAAALLGPPEAGRVSRDRALAQLVVALGLLDGNRAASAMDTLSRVDADAAGRCEAMRVRDVIAVLQRGGLPLRKQRVG